MPGQCKHDVISINRYYAFSEAALRKRDSYGAEKAQFLSLSPTAGSVAVSQIEKETNERRTSNVIVQHRILCSVCREPPFESLRI